MQVKKCGTCQKELPLESFYKDASRKDNHEACCKECRYTRVYTLPPEGRFKCTICKEVKDLQKFVKNRNHESGHTNKCLECDRIRGKKMVIKRKQKILNHYGTKCACCEESTFEFLTLDHINGGGNKHLKEIKGRSMYGWIIKNNYPEGYQILCMNCNFAKGKYGKCPHNKEIL